MSTQNKGDERAFPGPNGEWGLTKREWFAGIAMQGEHSPDYDTDREWAAICVAKADALIAELEKGTK